MNEPERRDTGGGDLTQQENEPPTSAGGAAVTERGSKRKAKAPIGSVGELIRRNYESRAGVKKLQRADVRAIVQAPALEETEQAELLALARADTKLQQTKQLLMLSIRTETPKIANGLRGFAREVLAGHPLFQGKTMAGVLANPQSMSMDAAVSALASADAKGLSTDPDKPLPRGQADRIRTNAVHCLLLLLRASKGLSLLRIQRALHKHVWAPKARLLDSCERAKIALSTRSSAGVYVGNFFRDTGSDDIDYTLSNEELEEVVGRLLDKGFARIRKVLADAGYGHEQVELCLATGGMANMPTVRQRLHAWFGPKRVSVPDETATLIAEGAARIAADNASLHLAKNVELELARSSYLPLLKAGTRMPRGGTATPPEHFHLYCTDPRDGKAKFQVCAPRRAGRKVRPNEPRMCLETMTVKVDAKAGLFRERLELTVQVDENLILHAHARSLNRRGR